MTTNKEQLDRETHEALDEFVGSDAVDEYIADVEAYIAAWSAGVSEHVRAYEAGELDTEDEDGK